MVSAQRYLETFFAVMPERSKLISELKARKAEIDKKVESSSPEEISQLIKIIGKDSWFFLTAEKRKKSTLRHMNWKLLKSLEYFEDFYKKTFERQLKPELRKVSRLDVFYAKLGQENLSLNEFILKFVPNTKYFLKRLDDVYKKEIYNLEISNIDAYRNLLREEIGIGENVKSLFSDMGKVRIEYGNIIKKYFGFVKSKSALSKEIGVNFAILLFGLVGLYQLYIGGSLLMNPDYKPLIEENRNLLGLASLMISLMELGVAFALFDVYSEFKNLLKFILKT